MTEAEEYKRLILQQVKDGDKTAEQVIATANNPRFSDRSAGPVQQGYIAAAEELQSRQQEGE